MFRFLRTMSHKALKVETNIKKTRKVWPFHEKGVSLLRFNNIHSFYFQKRMSKSQDLLSYIREGRTMTQREKLRLIVQLSIPSILAQISATVMFFIDASMVGHLGAKASASIGIVESTGWLMGGLASAANMGLCSGGTLHWCQRFPECTPCAKAGIGMLLYLQSHHQRNLSWHQPIPPLLARGQCGNSPRCLALFRHHRSLRHFLSDGGTRRINAEMFGKHENSLDAEYWYVCDGCCL